MNRIPLDLNTKFLQCHSQKQPLSPSYGPAGQIVWLKPGYLRTFYFLRLFLQACKSFCQIFRKKYFHTFPRCDRHRCSTYRIQEMISCIKKSFCTHLLSLIFKNYRIRAASYMFCAVQDSNQKTEPQIGSKRTQYKNHSGRSGISHHFRPDPTT